MTLYILSKRIKLSFVISACLWSVLLNAQQLSKEELNFIEENVAEIAVDENYGKGEWKAVIEQVKNKKIVLLGELNHGSREIFLSRNDLIKSLHREAGFNTILFETGIGEAFVANQYKAKMTPKIMEYSLIGQWQTSEFEELMGYIKSENMTMAGFDVQRGFGGFFKGLLEKECNSRDIAPDQYTTLEKRFGILKKTLPNVKTNYDSVGLLADQLIQDYGKLLKVLDSKTGETPSMELKFTQMTLENRITYLNYMISFTKDKDRKKRWEARDRAMAENVIWLAENIYKDEKIIIVGHNYHLAKSNKKEKVMGAFLMEQYPTQMYSIGMFTGEGVYAQNGERSTAPVAVDRLDIRHIIDLLKGKVHFLDVPAKRNKFNTWLFKDIVVNDSFIDLDRSNTQTLSRGFDGLILIDKTSMPMKEK